MEISNLWSWRKKKIPFLSSLTEENQGTLKKITINSPINSVIPSLLLTSLTR